MNKLYRATTALLLTFAIFTAGCKSTKEYANLAKAGTTYASAIDNLLVATGEIQIDATSESLLQDAALSKLSLNQYQRLSNEDKRLLQVLKQLRVHVKLLSKYFGLMYELATSDAPDRAEKAIGDGSSGLIGNLNSVGTALRGSGFLTGRAAAAAGPITKLAVSGIIRGALRDELNARQLTIRRELELQERLLKALSDRITANLSNIQNQREQRLVINPLTSGTPIGNPDEWVSNRRSVLTMKLTAEQLGAASDDVKKLREAFEDLISGKLTLDRIDSLIADFDSLLTISEKLKA
jgi:hypothetical protein